MFVTMLRVSPLVSKDNGKQRASTTFFVCFVSLFFWGYVFLSICCTLPWVLYCRGEEGSARDGPFALPLPCLLSP